MNRISNIGNLVKTNKDKIKYMKKIHNWLGKMKQNYNNSKDSSKHLSNIYKNMISKKSNNKNLHYNFEKHKQITLMLCICSI